MTRKDILQNQQGAVDLAATLVRDTPGLQAGPERTMAITLATTLAAALKLLADKEGTPDEAA